MTFLNITFPEDISYGARGGPEFSTTASILKNKSENRSSNWSSPRYKYFINYGLKTKKQIDELVKFFYICKGKERSFKYKDWNDYIAKDEYVGIFKFDENIFQLKKRYTVGSFFEDRIITKIVKDSLILKANGVEISKEKYTIDDTTGVVNFSQNLKENDIITADFEFFVTTRFDIDYLEINANQMNNFSSTVTLIEVKE